jgi:hypothetical protein
MLPSTLGLGNKNTHKYANKYILILSYAYKHIYIPIIFSTLISSI